MAARPKSVSPAVTQAQPATAVPLVNPASNTGSAGLTSGYLPTSAYDELKTADGGINAHWTLLLKGLAGLSHAERLDRIDRINLRVRETGIAHDLFADPSGTTQPWRLDLMPLILSAEMWSKIETAVIQRARLTEALLTDIYGHQTLMQRGLIPPQLVLSSPSYLRAIKHCHPPAGPIQFMALDLARGSDGTWRIVDTHLETPAGIGYALANRTVLTHISGDLFTASKAIRLAPFFQQMQESLAARAGRPDPSIALLTPGPRHNDFFSHSYLARYLGFLLVEGDDLRVDNDVVHLKTLGGLQPIDLIVRCVDGSKCDPLELDPAGFLGPVGLVQAMRTTPNLVANSLGAAVVEHRGFGGYLPTLCKELLGEDLAIWDVKKWWLGDAAARDIVLGDLDRYFIRQAYETTARPGRAAVARDPALLATADRASLIEEIRLNGKALVAEEKTGLGTTPSYGPNGLVPTPFALRVFASALPGGGFAVMPGGLAMTVNPGSSIALSAPGGTSRDVWVLSDHAQPVFKSLWRPTIEKAKVQRSPRELPSRAADNLFWLGRNIENADWTFRVLRHCLSRIEEDSGPNQNLALIRLVLNDLLDPGGLAPVPIPLGLSDAAVIAYLARMLVTSADRPNGLPQILGHVHRIASQSRDRLSLEAWRTLNAFYVARRWDLDALPKSIGEALDLIDSGLSVVAAFNGLSHENMTRNFGWSFLDMGRRLSRASNVSQLLLTALATPLVAGLDPAGDDTASLLFALELADSFITYRSRYRLNPVVPLVLDLLILDETNPRSLAYQLAALSSHIDGLPQAGKGNERTEVQKIALAMLHDVRIADVTTLAHARTDGDGGPAHRKALATLLRASMDRCPQLSDALTRRYFSVVEREPQWTRARSRSNP